MTRMAWVLAVVAAASLPQGVGAQALPDFSGRWTSEPEASAATPQRGGAQGGAARGGRAGRGRGARSGDMGSGWGSTISITQDAASLTVEYMFFVRGDMQPPLRFTFALDGTETVNSVMMGHGIQEQKSRAGWDSDRLVITTVHPFENPETGQPMTVEVKRTLSLASPASLLIETTRSGVLGGPPSTTRTTYRKLS